MSVYVQWILAIISRLTWICVYNFLGEMSRKRNRPEEWGDIEPSQVIHITDLPEHTLEIDLEKLLDKYGRIHEIIMLPNKRQALVEFEDQNDADRIIQRQDII